MILKDMFSPARAGRWMLIAAFLISLPVGLTSISNNDLPWHLSAARFMIQNRSLPHADFLSWTKAGEPWIDFEWGSQLIYYALYSLGGVPALWIFKALMLAFILWLFVFLLRLWEIPDSWAGTALIPLSFSLTPGMDLRPEGFSLFFLLLQLYLLESRRIGKSNLRDPVLALLHVLLYAAWSNLHAGFPVGIALCFIYLAGGGLEILWSFRSSRQIPAGWEKFLFPGTLGLAGVFGSFLNPFGWEVYSVTLEHARLLPILRAHILEWSPPVFSNVYQWPYWGILFFSLCVFGLGFRKIPATYLLLFLFLIPPSLQHSRNTSFFCLLALPLALKALHEFPSPEWWRRLRVPLLVFFLAFFSFFWYKTLLQAELLGKIEDKSRKPVEACRFLLQEKKALSPLRMYNPWGWGGTLGFLLHPDYKVFVDGRYLFHDYLPKVRQAKENPQTWGKFLDSMGIDLVLVENHRQMVQDPRLKIFRPADRYFMPEESWALVYWDSLSMIFIRRGKVPSGWIERREYKLLYPKDFQFLSLKIREKEIAFASVEAEARRYSQETADPWEKAEIEAALEEMSFLDRNPGK